jgi:ABC-type nitrate/sulfonate/bicarbonate transport system substrate-binding protein
MDAQWATVTLQDVLTTLVELIAEIEDDPQAYEELLAEHMPAVYAKLNFAWNTRHSGPAAIDTVDHDVLVGWPQDLKL